MPSFTFQEKGHSYELDGKKMTGVTTVLGVIAKPMLIGWAARMVCEHIRTNCEQTLLNGEPSIIKRYLVLESDLQEAVKAHTKKKEAAGEKGTDVHAEIESFIKYCLQLLDGYAVKFLESDQTSGFPSASREFDGFRMWAQKNNIRFLSSETPTYSTEWFVAGTPDFTFEKEGKRYVGDLKTMKKMWDRVPFFQTAAYMKMLEEQHTREVMKIPGDQEIPHSIKLFDGSCIVNINKETGELTDHWTYDHENDKKAFEAALTLYRQLNNF